jgi:hypothetical protein
MSSPPVCQPTLRVSFDPSAHGSGSVSVCGLSRELVAFFASCTRPGDLLKSIFRVTVTPAPSRDHDCVPDVSGRYRLFEDEVKFIPHFPFEIDVKYRISFDPRPLAALPTAESLNLEFVIPSEQNAHALTDVTHIFPSCGHLPENLLRLYVCFSNSMQRGRALEEISLLDSDGQPVADALYRPPVELWDRSMRHLTVLLDPGRLKRWAGPNVELGPPLKAGQKYTLEVGSGMIDLNGHPLRERFRKDFLVGAPVREQITVESWKILSPATGGRQALVLMFPSPLDWALLLQTIRVESADGLAIDGRVEVDQCETRWSFTPSSAWTAGIYQMRIGSGLEDVCGNSITGPFDRPLRSGSNLLREISSSSLNFQLL